MIKRIGLAMLLTLAACDRPADIASRNISMAADNFQVNRKIHFYNSWQGVDMLEIDGLCSLGNNDAAGTATVTCMIGPNSYKKHFLYLSSNTTVFVEQIDDLPVNTYHYAVMFNPAALIPNFQMPK